MIGLGMAIPIGKVETNDDAAGTNDGKSEGRHNNIVMKEAYIIEGKNGFSWPTAEVPSSLDFCRLYVPF